MGGKNPKVPMLYFQSLLLELEITLPTQMNGHHLLLQKTCTTNIYNNNNSELNGKIKHGQFQ